jgi:hypothetical protein
VLAQIAGVLPLILDHTFHSYEPQVVEEHDHAVPGRHGDHRHGIADVKDECCWMNHLTGIDTFIFRSASGTVVAVKMISTTTKFLIATALGRLDRPPKTLSLT